jgi:hypothetical protein
MRRAFFAKSLTGERKGQFFFDNLKIFLFLMPIPISTE